MSDPSPVVLSFDTSGGYCAAALLRDDALVDARSEKMSRGQAERLIPFLSELLSDAGIGWSDLTRIGVGVGPGNFTGIRISVAAARGLAMGLGIPAVGVSALDARALAQPNVQVAVPAPRDQVYVADPEPRLADAAEVPAAVTEIDPDELVGAIARLAAAATESETRPPASLYIRGADAAPMRDSPPRILD